GKGFYSPLVYVLECHRLGIPLLPPFVNEPGPAFTVVHDECEKMEENPKPESRIPKEDQNLNSEFRKSDCPTSRFMQHAIRNTSQKIRIPVLLVKGLTNRTKDTILAERAHSPFSSLTDFFLRVRPLPEEMDSLIRVGAFDPFGQTRTTQYWQFKSL